eukprot:gnl/TRDRNA2_/TRDRNA2_159072_c0_seq4.p1 gnl/TRDRNA2_/TRDRNA2_159072_c0~~gnl/TRDRNA2_/TRDRNA2_159072_c0_seq4.p1  ORF type:complete len:111 (-),score=17.51 gnl/TRDRNA2_/TRDRNA2_159072_c0_seq4:59-391(-)
MPMKLRALVGGVVAASSCDETQRKALATNSAPSHKLLLCTSEGEYIQRLAARFQINAFGSQSLRCLLHSSSSPCLLAGSVQRARGLPSDALSLALASKLQRSSEWALASA